MNGFHPDKECEFEGEPKVYKLKVGYVLIGKCKYCGMEFGRCEAF